MLKLQNNPVAPGKKPGLSPRPSTVPVEKSRPASPEVAKPVLEPGAITRAHVEVFVKFDENELHQNIAETLSLTDWRTNARHSIELDLYYSAFQFAAETGLSVDKTAAFMDLLKELHSRVTTADIHEAQRRFTTSIMQQTVPRAPSDTPPVFTPEDAKRVTDYLIQTYFQHYKLYQHVYKKEQPIQLSERKIIIQTSVEPPPLASAITDDEWKAIVEQKRLAQQAHDAEAAAFREAVSQAMHTQGDAAGEPPNIDPDGIRKLAEAAAVTQVTTVKDAVKQRLEASEATLLESAAKRLEGKK